MVSEETIKSGPEVVTDFLETLKANKKVDEKIVGALTALVSEGKLSKTRLLNSMQSLRENQNNSSSADSPPKESA